MNQMQNQQPDAQPFVSVADAEQQARVAELQAQAAYYRAATGLIDRQYSMSVDGAVPTRLDEAWSTGDPSYRGPIREEDTETLSALRSRARHLEKANILASSVLDRHEENVIGPAIRIKPTVGTERFKNAVKRWLSEWSKPSRCDVRGLFGFGAQMRMSVRMRGRDGDVGIVLATKPRFLDDGRTDLMADGRQRRDPKLQIIPGHRIKTPREGSRGYMPNGNQVVEGVEMDGDGRPLAFHVEYAERGGRKSSMRIAARDFIYLHNTDDYENTRGASKFRGSFRMFEWLVGYLESVIVAARVGASQAMIRKTKSPAQMLNAMRTVTTAGGVQQKWQPIEPGGINYISTDDELVPFNPSQPQQQMPAAVDVFARFLGLKWGLSLESVLLKFENLSWSTSKAVRAATEEVARKEREDIVVNGVSRIYQWALSIAVDNGDLVDENGSEIPDSEIPDRFWAHEWIPPAKASVDPKKDAEAAKAWIELSCDARSFAAAEQGYDFDDLVAQNAADRKKMTDAGLPLGDESEKAGGVEVSPDGTLKAKPGKAEEVADDGDVKFKRELLKGMLSMPAAREAIYEAIDKPNLLTSTGVKPQAGYVFPHIPLVASSGPLVSGATISDPDGNIVGGDIENALPAESAGRNGAPSGGAGAGGDEPAAAEEAGQADDEQKAAGDEADGAQEE